MTDVTITVRRRSQAWHGAIRFAAWAATFTTGVALTAVILIWASGATGTVLQAMSTLLLLYFPVRIAWALADAVERQMARRLQAGREAGR